MKIQTFAFKKMCLKMSSPKQQPLITRTGHRLCLHVSLSVLIFVTCWPCLLLKLMIWKCGSCLSFLTWYGLNFESVFIIMWINTLRDCPWYIHGSYFFAVSIWWLFFKLCYSNGLVFIAYYWYLYGSLVGTPPPTFSGWRWRGKWNRVRMR